MTFDLVDLGLVFVTGLLFGYGIAKRPRRRWGSAAARRVVESTWCQGCRAFHDLGCPMELLAEERKRRGLPPVKSKQRYPKCMECGAFHENFGECPLVAGGARRIQ